MSKPATIAQSGTVQLPTITRRRGVEWSGLNPAHHRVAVGDTFAVMVWQRNSYDIVTVLKVWAGGTSVTVSDEWTDETHTMSTNELMFLAGQAVAHLGHAVDAPQIGYATPADGAAHGITTTGACVVCKHR